MWVNVRWQVGWHQTLKTRALLEHCCLPGGLERQTGVFVEHDGNQQHHGSFGKVTPAVI